MAFMQRKALGALLAASIVTPLSCVSDAAPPSASSSSTSVPHGKRISTPTLSEVNKLPDGQSSTSFSLATISNAEEAAHARALLDRYYAISAEAQVSNESGRANYKLKTHSTPQAPTDVTPTRLRTPASKAFQQLNLSNQLGPIKKRYVICGGGTAAWAAIEAILKKDPNSANEILLITDENLFPYNRTMLSKELWNSRPSSDKSSAQPSEKDTVEYAYRHVPKDSTISVVKNTRVISLDVDEKTVELSDGSSVHYDKVLLATGGSPKTPAFVSKAFATPGVREHVSVFRTLDDFELAQKAAESGNGVIVVGGGFLGTELSIALAGKTKNVTLVVAEVGVLYRSLPRYLCEFLARKIEELGVKIVSSAVVSDAKVETVHKASVQDNDGPSDVADGSIVDIDNNNDNDNIKTVDKISLSVIGTKESEEIAGGHVVVAAGIEPEVKLAKDAGLEIDAVRGGVMVNDFMMAEPDVFVAGDMASFHDRTLGRRRVEHWDHAVVTGRIAGSNMSGARQRYGLQSMFWSDLTNIGVDITAVGLVDSKLETFGVWNTAVPVMEDVPAMNELVGGAVFYISKEMEIVGVVLWNAKKGSGALRRARALVDARVSAKDFDYRMMGNLVNVPDGSFRMYVRTKAS